MLLDVLRAPRRARARLLPVALLVLAAAGACTDRAPTTPVVEGLVVRETILVDATGEVVAFSHRDHWHGAPVVRAGDATTLTMHFTDWQATADDHDAPPVDRWFTLATRPPEYDVRAVIEHDALARWTGDRVRGTLRGLAAGASRLSLVVRRSGATLYEAPPLNFRVQ